MLSAQRKEFEEKKKDESPYPRDFARWSALDYFRRRRLLTSCRFYVTLGFTIAFALVSVASLAPGPRRAHQAALVARAHTLLEPNCANCHDRAFQPVLRLFGCPAPSVSDQSCKACHEGAVHQRKQARDPACASCHREHRGHETLARHVADRNCTDCHAALDRHLKPNESTAFQRSITQFNRDHPEFQPSLPGKKDPAQIKFNHQAHLDLDLDALRSANEKAGRDRLSGLGAKMACADCHQMDAERRYLRPIVYDNHCARCHTLSVALVGDFEPKLKAAVDAFAQRPLPHRAPEIVRGVLRDRLVEFARAQQIVGGKGAPSLPRPLPWQPVTDEQWSWASEQAKKAESLLFMNKQWSKAEAMTGCSQCHIEKERVAGLPVYEPTAIPARWYPHSVFNHGSHRTMACVDCHDKNAAGRKVAASRTATDILMPTLQSCRECHQGAGAARNACVECHRYHQR